MPFVQPHLVFNVVPFIVTGGRRCREVVRVASLRTTATVFGERQSFAPVRNRIPYAGVNLARRVVRCLVNVPTHIDVTANPVNSGRTVVISVRVVVTVGHDVSNEAFTVKSLDLRRVLFNLGLCKRLIISGCFVTESPEHDARMVVMLPYHVVILSCKVVEIVIAHRCLQFVHTRGLCLHNDAELVAPVINLLRVRVVR